MEKAIEAFLFASRWLMAPIYVGLVLTLVALLAKFVQELFHFLPHVLEMTETQVILAVLTFVDISFAASLLVMIIVSGYENFVSKIDTGGADRPSWMGQIDFGGQKLKLISSIVAISGIHLLKSFMNIENVDRNALMWLVITHITFVVSGVLLALMDWLHEKAGKH
jgi:uncharacterized protein (TIGR00645 family)